MVKNKYFRVNNLPPRPKFNPDKRFDPFRKYCPKRRLAAIYLRIPAHAVLERSVGIIDGRMDDKFRLCGFRSGNICRAGNVRDRAGKQFTRKSPHFQLDGGARLDKFKVGIGDGDGDQAAPY